MTQQNNMRGYTIVELMIALVVSSIVIAGSLVGFNIIEKQFNEVNLETALDRQAANFIRELQKDISMAGYNGILSLILSAIWLIIFLNKEK